MKTLEESNDLKEKIENLNKDLSELTEDYLSQVVVGINGFVFRKKSTMIYMTHKNKSE